MAIPRKDKEELRRRAKDNDQQRKNEEARGKREANAEVQAKPPTWLDGPNVSDTGEKYFTRADRLELLLAQERAMHAETKVKANKSALQAHETAYLLQRAKLADASSAAAVEHHKATEELRKLHREIEATYGVKISEITFDDTTGLIRVDETKH